MNYLFAPMEGITGRIYRRVHARYYPGIGRYYAPFFSPSGDHHFPLRGLTDLLPEENPGVPLVPQLLTNRAEDFIWAAASLLDRGYGEVNLNLGCPSGTVTAKAKGAGFLREPEKLDAFLEEVFSAPALGRLRISVKTRLGYAGEEEFPGLLDIYRKYPLDSLIVHPRLRQDFYTGPIRPAAFARALENTPFPVIWNGDLFRPADLEALLRRFPALDTVMLGRGLVSEPGLARRMETGEACSRSLLQEFHDALLEEYRAVLYGDTALCHRMKEVWSYLILHFEGREKYWKRIQKAKSLSEFRLAAQAVFRELPLLPDTDMAGLAAQPPV
ncbi:MAG: tRNA-dihydrouridine synthase family protein [Oscillospiraceae bacterium]|nr:tRNA-dihydrouridine synthase family protein [Oscillospiraceae bacterium]